MKVANGTYSKIGAFDRYSCSHEAKVNAATALRIIIEKIGNYLSDEMDILRILLASDVRDVREQGIIAAENTWKNPWRKNILESGLIRRLRLEPEQDLRNRSTLVIVRANPKVLLEECTKDDGSKYFPIELITVINNPSIKLNMVYGLCNLFSAQRKEGKFYKDFKETPVLDSPDVERCFKYSILVLQDLVNESTLSIDERKILHNTCVLISYLLDKDLNPVVKSLEQQVYNNYVNKLSNINLSKFIEFTTHSQFAEESWKEENTWVAAKGTLKVALPVTDTRCRNPLANYLSLRADVERMKTALRPIQVVSTKPTNPYVVSNLNDVLDMIDSSIESYLAGKNFKGIMWQEVEEFNSGFPRLLQLLDSSRNVNCRLAVLNTMDNLTQNGITVARRSLPFDSIVNEQNIAALGNVLRNNVYFQSVLRKQLTSPTPATVQEKALLLTRQLTTSFKDYFGLTELKEKALETASEIIAGKRFKKGFILSGINGMGKSFFGKTLAGELALLLQVIKGKTIDADRLQVFGVNRPVTLEEYFELLKKHAPLVLMLDEIQFIAPADGIELTDRFIKCLEGVMKSDAPIILVGTTNEPEPVLIEGLHINEGGSSTEVDKVLKTRIHPFCFEVMDGYYPFNQESLGIDFTRDYLTYLQKTKKLKGNEDIEQAVQFARGIKLVDIIQIITESLIPKENIFSLDTVSSRLSKLSADLRRRELEELVSLLESSIRYLTLKPGYKIEGDIDYKLLATVADSIPIKSLGQLLNNVPQAITQESLLFLLNSYRKDYQS
ncbi:MAG: AAA family ATPase [Candidatus Melainabacteria bacterium]|nr:AAA family ATPase [Candidatus Melainabacteria bacterium]